MRRVIVESPYAANSPEELAHNLEYARRAMLDCLQRGEAPFASHLLYTQAGVLDDKKPEDRTLGIKAGFAWRNAADATIVYDELGISSGMEKGIAHARAHEQPIEFRKLGGKWSKPRDQIFNDTPCYWHGCWLEAGHALFSKSGKCADDRLFEHMWLDGGYAPKSVYERTFFVMQSESYEDRRSMAHRGRELPQGRFLRHVIQNNKHEIHTLLAWWDRTQGDTRGACNSCYIVKGEHTTAAMLKWFPIHFPKQAERLTIAGIDLVEVFPS